LPGSSRLTFPSVAELTRQVQPGLGLHTTYCTLAGDKHLLAECIPVSFEPTARFLDATERALPHAVCCRLSDAGVSSP
jgi:hypothetical protein